MKAARSIANAILFAALAVVSGSCTHAHSSASVEPPLSSIPVVRIDATRASPVILVTIDGARWQEVFLGTDPSRLAPPRRRRTAEELMPTLHALGRDEGAFIGAPGGEPIRATGPNFVSLPGYAEILSGRSATTCTNNECPQTRSATILDAAASAGLRVAAFASWERLSRAITAWPGSFFVSAGRDPNDKSSPYPGFGRYRPDAKTAELALAHLAAEQPDFLFIGLGDTDEHAHHGNYDGYLAALEAADDVLRRVRVVLEGMGERGEATHIFVTSDHGRARDFKSHGGFAPESSRVWLVGSGPRIQARGVTRSPQERRLCDVAPTIAAVIGLERDDEEDDWGDVLGELLDHSDSVSTL